MAMITIATFLLCAWVVQARYSRLSWSDCGSDPSITIHTFDVTPMPMAMPGPIDVTIQGRVGRELGDMDIKMDIERQTYFFGIPIPCFYPLGSCDFMDALMSEKVDESIKDFARQVQTMLSTVSGLNTTECPVPAFDIDIRQYRLYLPAMPSVISFLTEGDYSLRMTASEKDSSRKWLCLGVGFTIEN